MAKAKKETKVEAPKKKNLSPVKAAPAKAVKAAPPAKAPKGKNPKAVVEDIIEAEFEELDKKEAPPKAAKKSKQNNTELVEALDKILEAELSGVVRYLHYSFMIFGPNRIPITKWFRDHALEGFAHAVTIGEKITALGGHPSIKVHPVPETNKHNVMEILKESVAFERETLQNYHDLLPLADNDISLEEMVRGLIHEETQHIEEVEKMIRK